MKNDSDNCVQCGKPMVASLLTDEEREAVREAARLARGEVEIA